MSFTNDSKVCIDMQEYLLKAIFLYGEEGMKPVTTIARNKLRVTDKTSPTLDDDKKNF